MPDTAAPAAAPTRTQRQLCWEHRDKYFACLESRGVTVPPGTDMSDGRGPVGKAAAADQAREEKERAGKKNEARAQDPCKELRGGYEDNCARSWIDYFNKRRVLEARQKLMYAQAEADRAVNGEAVSGAGTAGARR